MKTRIRRSTEQWQALLQAQQASHLSVADFCRQESLDAKYFSKHKRAAQLENQESPGPSFIKIQTVSTAVKRSESGLILHHQSTRLQMDVTVDAAWLAQLMNTLS